MRDTFRTLSLLLLCVAGASAVVFEASAETDREASPVYAEVGPRTIRVSDVFAELQRFSPQVQADIFKNPKRLHEFAKRYVEVVALAREATRRKLDESPGVLKSLHRALRSSLETELTKKLAAKPVTEDALRSVYEKNKSEYVSPEYRRAHLILVSERSKAMQLIKQLRNESLAKFRKAAAEYSLDTETKMRGGDLGFFTIDGVREHQSVAPVATELAKAAFGLKERGAVSPSPIRVGDGFALLFLSGIRASRDDSFEDAKASLRQRLRRERLVIEKNALLGALRKKYRVKVFEDRLNFQFPPNPKKENTNRNTQ